MPAWKDVVAIGSELPAVEESTSYGTPALKVKGKLMCRLKEDGESIAVHVIDLEDKEALLLSDPDVFFTTPHYDGYAMVLVRLAKIRKPALRELLEDAWRHRAPKRVLAEYDDMQGGCSG